MSEETSTVSTKVPLPNGLEEKAIAFFRTWEKGDAHRKEMDVILRGLSPAQSSLVQRRAQRFGAGDAKPEQ